MNSRPHANVLMLATQQLDGLDRPLSLCVGGRSTQYRYVANQLPASCHVLADGQEVEYAYVPALGNLVRQIRADGEVPQDYSYDPLLGLIQTRKGALGQQTTTYNASGQPSTDTWSVEGAKYLTTWHHSLCGRVLGLEDASKLTHSRAYDEHGRLCQFQIDQITCCIDYDELSRPCTHTTTDSASGQTLVRTLTFDHLGRELTRRFVNTDGNDTSVQVQTLTYTDLDQIKTRHWQEGTRQSQESYGYDVLGRLVLYTSTPGITQDPFGNWVVEQSFTLNPLDGYDSVRTIFADGSSDQASYHYDNAEDPCQVTAIEHTHPSWPARISLNYDARGRLASDSLGRRLKWDAQDRVTQVEYQGQVCTYGYDPSGNLCDRQIGTQTSRAFYSADQLTHEQRGDDLVQLLSDASEHFALNRLTQEVRQGVMLLGCDGQGSVCMEADSQARHRHYTVHGAEATAPTLGDNPFGFAGERREPLTGWYIAGGYRPYDPLLSMFLAPDSASPFAEGGINAYAYCGGDPVNRIDPDGHGWWDWVKVGMGLVLGGVGAAISFGALAPLFAAGISALTVSAVLSMTSAVLATVSGATGVASTLMMLADKDSKASEVLGYISVVTGWASTISGLGAKYSDWRKEHSSPRGYSPNRARSRSSSGDGLNTGTFRPRTFSAGSRSASPSPNLSLRSPSRSPVPQGGARALNNRSAQSLETPGIEMDMLSRPGTPRTGSPSTQIGPRTPSPSPSVSSADVASSPPPRPSELSTAGHTPPPHNRFGQLSADTNGAGSTFAARGSASQRPPVERLFGYYYSMGQF